MGKITRLFGALALLLFASYTAKSQCLTLSFNITPVSCVGACDGAITVTVTGNTGPCTYMWTPGGEITQTITGLCAGSYTVMVTDSVGCFDYGVAIVTDPSAIVPSLCMVTCNSNSTYNVVYWDKTVYSDVDSFLIYREVMPGSYARIASVSYDSLSEFVDTAQSMGPANGDPNEASYRYKMQILFNCGSFSAMSPYHRTIHIEDSGAGEFSWALRYEIEGAPNPVTNYVLICDTLDVDVWTPVAVVSPTDTLAVDPNFATHAAIANWRVKTAWPITCTSTRATVNTTRSNIKNASMTTGIAGPNLSDLVQLFPNPANDQITLMLSDAITKGSISIFNMTGQLVYEAQVTGVLGVVTVKHIDITHFSSGLYSIMIDNNGQRLHKKLVVK